MDKPILSPDFTMEDLHKLREYNSLRHINMTTEEINAELSESVREFNERIEQIRADKKQLVAH